MTICGSKSQIPNLSQLPLALFAVFGYNKGKSNQGGSCHAANGSVLQPIRPNPEGGAAARHGLHRAHRHRLCGCQGPVCPGRYAGPAADRGQRQHHQERQERGGTPHRRPAGHSRGGCGRRRGRGRGGGAGGPLQGDPGADRGHGRLPGADSHRGPPCEYRIPTW